MPRFDSSVGRGDGTFPVRIGTGQVIKGEILHELIVEVEYGVLTRFFRLGRGYPQRRWWYVSRREVHSYHYW